MKLIYYIAPTLLAATLTFSTVLGNEFTALPKHEINDSLYIKFEKNSLRYRTSYETMKMDGEPSLGMLGIGANLFLIKSLPQLYFSLNSYSAIQGKRPGLITFGTGLGWNQSLGKSPLSVDAGLYLGGGGGAGAPDGGGLITRGHIQLGYNIKSLQVFGGYSMMDFPSGEMRGNQVQFGLSYTTPFIRSNRAKQTASISPSKDTIANSRLFRVTIGAQNYIHFIGNPTFNRENSVATETSLLGIGIDQFFAKNWYATLKLHGALSGGIDGYMSYLVGLGYENKLFNTSATWDAQIVAGPSGGGDVATGGGAITQANLGIRKNLWSDLGGKIGIGQTWSPDGDFAGTFLELGITKGFNFLSPKNTKPLYALATEKYKARIFDIAVLNRTYISPDALDKNGRPYDEMFNLLGFLFTKQFYKHWEAVGATYWAYEGSYGAYAEGLIGVGYTNNLNHNWKLKSYVLIGSAGGGGIDLGDGFVYQYQIGVDRYFNDNLGLKFGVGQMRGFQGNFKPVSLDIGLVYKIEKTEKL